MSFPVIPRARHLAPREEASKLVILLPLGSYVARAINSKSQHSRRTVIVYFYRR
jgi:hypothetical protein